MRLVEFIAEGGWDSAVTQSTVINPALVGQALKQVAQFVRDFNQWLPADHPQIKMGHPTGSSAYHEIETQEDPEKVYGDIDLQMVAEPITPVRTLSAYSSEWNRLVDQFIQEQKPSYIYAGDRRPVNGHPIFQVGKDLYVQVDFMWHPPDLAQWGRYRATPERGLKGALLGNLYSTLGEILGMSIQHGGVQIKTQDGQPVSFSKQKNVTVNTISTNIETFVRDILLWIYKQQGHAGKPKIDRLLSKNTGIKTDQIKAQDLVLAIQGLANSFALNDMYGGQLLEKFDNPRDFINSFLQHYEQKTQEAVSATKFDKAATPEAQKRAADTKNKLIKGLDLIKTLFQHAQN